VRADRGVGRGVAAMRAAAADWISTRFGHSVEPPNLDTRERSSSADRDGGSARRKSQMAEREGVFSQRASRALNSATNSWIGPVIRSEPKAIELVVESASG